MYGDIKITLLKTETLAEYTVRTFALERVSLSKIYILPSLVCLPSFAFVNKCFDFLSFTTLSGSKAICHNVSI